MNLTCRLQQSAASGARLLALAVLLLASWVFGVAHAAIPVYGFVVKNAYPHDPQAFTQGLVFKDGWLFESTGLNGRSSIRKVELETGKVLMKQDLAEAYFGEGIALFGQKIIGLTWQSQVGFVFDIKNFALEKRVAYAGEGWGLACDGSHLYMSDGTSTIRLLNPDTLKEIRRFQVTADGVAIPLLNELEWVEGELFANVWGTDVIARINPASGQVVGWIDLTGLLAPRWRQTYQVDVLNGIAYDSLRKRLFVTGKWWPRLFEIGLVASPRSEGPKFTPFGGGR